MKTFSGRHLFPDHNQVFRIRNVVKSIYEEVCELEDIENYQEFCEYINQELEQHSYKIDDAFNPALLSRLMQFGKNSTAANSLKVLEHLPLLHVVTQNLATNKYSEQDLKRIALGQPIQASDEITLSMSQLKTIKRALLEAVALIDIIDNPISATIPYDADLTERERYLLYTDILLYESNLSCLIGAGILSDEDIESYNKTQKVPDHIFQYMLNNCEIPNTVKCFFTKHLMSTHNYKDDD